MARNALIVGCALTATVCGQVTQYECGMHPEHAEPPWERIGSFDTDHWIEDGDVDFHDFALFQRAYTVR